MAGFIGSEDILTTTSTNQEIIPQTPVEWTDRKYHLIKVSLRNLQPCHIIINNQTRLFLDAEQGFEFEQTFIIRDITIDSIKIEESNVSYQFIGIY